jgi:hypothetical protein
VGTWIGLRLRHVRNGKTRKTGLFFAKGRFFGVWTGAEAGDKSLGFSRALKVSGLSARQAAGACEFDGIREWMALPASGRALRPAGRFRICCW